MQRILSVIVGVIVMINLQGQTIDSVNLHKVYAPSVTVVGSNSKKDIHFLPEIVGASIHAGKKNNLLVLDNIQGNTVTNTMRQIVAKIPGIHIWESDGSGIQIGIAARGLSPNRSWEFNVRQNGNDIAADPFGYPEAYYNPQLQAVQRIQILRGQAALQYGPQFGGLVNYILKDGSQIKKSYELETQNSIGSNKLFNNYTAIGGTYKKINYYAFADLRTSEGWRNNSSYFTNNYSGSITYHINTKTNLQANYTYSHIRSQQPGGLTDIQFENNAQQSLRNRNWMDIVWKTINLNFEHKPTKHNVLKINAFAVLGDRNSIGFLQSILVNDTINATTKAYNNRTIDIDMYRNFGTEIRFLQNYMLANKQQSLSAGIRLYTGTTSRFRNGKGSNSTIYSKQLIDGIWPTNLSFTSNNFASFVENIFHVGKKFLIIPGARFENIKANVTGQSSIVSGTPILLVPQTKSRSFGLLGLNTEYHISKETEIYAGIAEAYRPIQFADLITPPTTDIVDPNIKDAKGFNADLGYRGNINNWLTFDASIFFLQYNNRIGSITQQRIDGSFYNYRTNTGSSTSSGIESMFDINVVSLLNKKSKYQLNIYNSYAYTKAVYNNLLVITRNTSNQLVTNNLKNKLVENAPQHILRTGVTAGYKRILLTTQLSYTSETYSDANNTLTPNSNAQIGLIPSYTIIDVFCNVQLQKNMGIKLSINNVANKKYFTRRASGYPGPGLLPADGRSITATLGIKI